VIYYPTLTRVIPLTTIRRERVLPVDGNVLVRAGAHVEPMSLIARAEVPGRYSILNVAQALRVSPESADTYIRLRPGQAVQAGKMVAGRKLLLGLVPRVVRAPRDGVVAAVGGGRVLLETAGEPVEVRAYVPGTVVTVIPQRGVTVETVGALIQGVWGLGGQAFGVLKVLVDRADQPLLAKAIDVTCHGALLVGGSTIDRDALQQALELQVRGIVIGSLDPTLLGVARNMPFPIVMTEGLGQVSMARPIFRLLRTNDGREAAINGVTQPRWGEIRPEIIIPLPTRSAPTPPPPNSPLQPAVRVRVTRGPARSRVGTVRSLPKQPIALKIEARVWGATVAFDDGGEQFVPLHNLELLG
jgi:hypothetical protein